MWTRTGTGGAPTGSRITEKKAAANTRGRPAIDVSKTRPNLYLLEKFLLTMARQQKAIV